MADEKRYYDDLLKWLEQRKYFTEGKYFWNKRDPLYFRDIGPSKRTRLDLFGIRNIQHAKYFDDIEIVGIEVILD